MAVWQAFKEGRPYLLESRDCPVTQDSCRPTDYIVVKDSLLKP